MASNPRPLLVFFGHHKCATRWINSIVRGVSAELGLKHATVWDTDMFGGDLRRYVEDNGIEFLSYTNAEWKHAQTLPPYRGFHVVRDPRDILVSAYFSHLKTHETRHWPELIPHRERIRSLEKAEGLLVDMDFVRDKLDKMFDWVYHSSNVHETRLETLSANPVEAFTAVFSSLQILETEKLSVNKRLISAVRRRLRKHPLLRSSVKYPDLPREKLSAVIERNRFAKKAQGRKPGSEDRSSHYRKGQAGDWSNHFTEEHIRYFKDHFNPLLLKLGYETNEDWS